MRLQFPAESGQLLLRNDTQRRSGEAAAVDPDSTLAPQHTAAQSQGHSQGLVLRRAGGGDILEVFPGGCAGSIDQRQKARTSPDSRARTWARTRRFSSNT